MRPRGCRGPAGRCRASELGPWPPADDTEVTLADHSVGRRPVFSKGPYRGAGSLRRCVGRGEGGHSSSRLFPKPPPCSRHQPITEKPQQTGLRPATWPLGRLLNHCAFSVHMWVQSFLANSFLVFIKLQVKEHFWEPISEQSGCLYRFPSMLSSGEEAGRRPPWAHRQPGFKAMQGYGWEVNSGSGPGLPLWRCLWRRWRSPVPPPPHRADPSVVYETAAAFRYLGHHTGE